jgi:hypothetical protein
MTYIHIDVVEAKIMPLQAKNRLMFHCKSLTSASYYCLVRHPFSTSLLVTISQFFLRSLAFLQEYLCHHPWSSENCPCGLWLDGPGCDGSDSLYHFFR